MFSLEGAEKAIGRLVDLSQKMLWRLATLAQWEIDRSLRMSEKVIGDF